MQVITPDINQIMKNQKRIAALSHDIDKGSSKMGENLIHDLEFPDTIGLGQGSKFQLWSAARKREVDESLTTVSTFLTDLASESKEVTNTINNLTTRTGQRQNARNLSQAAGIQRV